MPIPALSLSKSKERTKPMKQKENARIIAIVSFFRCGGTIWRTACIRKPSSEDEIITRGGCRDSGAGF